MADITIVDIQLPWEVVDACNGFSLDIGASLFKAVYLHKDDYISPKKRTTEYATLQCVSFPVADLTNALLYLKSRIIVHRDKPGDDPDIFTTGLGCSQYAETIRTILGIRAINVTETECFVAAFTFLVKTKNKGEILHQLDQDKITAGASSARANIRLYDNMYQNARHMDAMNISEACAVTFPMEIPCDPDARFTEHDGIFPCLLVNIGSFGYVMYVREDGTYRYANDIRRAGRTFLSMASLLTKSKTYEEIMSKAEKGNMKNVHYYFSDLKKGIDTSEDNLYSGIAKVESEIMDPIVYPMGRAVYQDLDDFSCDDIAKGLLYTTIHDMVQTVHLLIASFPEVKHVFFSGGFINHSLTREFIANEWMQRDARAIGMYGQKGCTNVHFLKHDAYLGALGAYLNPKLKFIDI